MPFNIDLNTDHPNFSTLFDIIEAEVKPMIPVKKYTRNHYAAHLKLILLNLLKAYRQNRQRYVAYSNKRNSFYPQKLGAQGLRISYAPFRHIVQSLEALEYITTKRGFNFPHLSCIARMQATEKLKELFRPARNTFPDENRIVLKGMEGNYLPFTETPATRKMRDNLKLLNDQLNKHFIGLYVPDKQLQILRNEMKKKKRPHVDLSKTLLHRTFSRGSFDLGGRFHGGFWIPLLKEYRPFVRIDHEKTECLDFSATVFSLMYLEKGLVVPEGDAYLIPGIDPRDREVLKAAAQMVVNTFSRAGALKAIRYDLLQGKFTRGEYTAEEIVDGFEQKHAAIKDMFYMDLGVKFQRVESDIAEAIMLRFAAMGKPILPIHDGFLVKRDDAFHLESAMTDEVVARYGRPMPFKVGAPSKLLFHPGEDEKESYAEYYNLWREWRLEREAHQEELEQEEHQEQLGSDGSHRKQQEVISLPQAA